MENIINKRWERQEAKRPDGPHGWIQWKGTDVCMDVTCSCGSRGHIDQDFAYKYKCLACNKLFDIVGYVHLIEVPADEMTKYDIDGLGTAVAVDGSLTPSTKVIEIPNPDAPEETEPMYEDDAPPVDLA